MKPLDYDTISQILDLMEPTAVFDKDGYYLYVNQSWRDSSGVTLSDEELSKKHSWDVVPDSRLRTILETKKPIVGEIIGVQKKKTFISYIPIFKKGEFFGVLMHEILRGTEQAKKASALVNVLQQELDLAHSSIAKLEEENLAFSEIVGQSDKISALRQDILEAARSNSTVLIEGETGTGKELAARAIHLLSKRSFGKFVPVNCSAIPASLAESELFGYEEGAFTGAKKGGHIGKLELADKGTLFLDEIHQMDLFMQPKLLRVLQEHQIERVGSSHSIPVDFRCIAASNINLREQINKEKFRDDLFYRLNVVHIFLPTLRERKEDIPLLVDSFINRLNAHLGTHIITVNNSALQMLMDYDWPGNVRELQNVVEAAMNRAWDGILEIKHFKLDSDNQPKAKKGLISGFNRNKELFEKELILETLQKCHWNKSAAAEMLGISRSVLYSKIKKYELH